MYLESQIQDLAEAVRANTESNFVLSRSIPESAPQGRVLSIAEFAEAWSTWSESQIRDLIRNRGRNGMGGAFSKIGKLWKIDEDRFFHLGRERAAELVELEPAEPTRLMRKRGRVRLSLPGEEVSSG